jgi:hypothetical protein
VSLDPTQTIEADRMNGIFGNSDAVILSILFIPSN